MVRFGGRVSNFGFVACAAALLPLLAIDMAKTQSVDEIIVTATKRAENLQDIPASISQISGEDLTVRGIVDIESLAKSVPHVSFGKYGTNTFVGIRGIGTTVDAGVAEPSVATYVDGVFLPRTTMTVTRQVDLERVEVLRGPQGTLYGRNATGGAINFVSRGPTDVFEGAATLGIKERNGTSLDAFLSGPLGERSAFRLSGGVVEQDGYIDNVADGEELLNKDTTYARGALRFTPRDDLTIDISVYHEEDDGRHAAQSVFTTPEIVGVIAQATQTPFNHLTEPYKLYGNSPYSGTSETTISTLRLDWDISETMSFRAITGAVDHFVNS